MRAAAGAAETPSEPEGEPPRRVPLWIMSATTIGIDFAVCVAFKDDPGWKDPDHEWVDGWTRKPQADNDDPIYNYVLHPWAGAEYYLMARNRHWNMWGSLLYSAGMSAFFEYVPENILQQPSSTDLIVTPLVGSVLGEARYRAKQAILRNPHAVPWAKAWLTLLDPVDFSVGGYPDGTFRLYFNWSHMF